MYYDTSLDLYFLLNSTMKGLETIWKCSLHLILTYEYNLLGPRMKWHYFFQFLKISVPFFLLSLYKTLWDIFPRKILTMIMQTLYAWKCTSYQICLLSCPWQQHKRTLGKWYFLLINNVTKSKKPLFKIVDIQFPTFVT